MRKWVWPCGIILAMFVAGYGAIAILSAIGNTVSDFRHTEQVAWDEAELNAILTTALQFENNTNEEIRLFDFQTTCGCVILGEKAARNGRSSPLTLPPHSKQALGVNFTNRGIPGEGLRHVVSFSVDKYPGKRFHTDLLIRNVIGTTEANPAAVVISDTFLGATKEFFIEVLDNSTEAREFAGYDFQIPGLDISRIEHVRNPGPFDINEKSKSRVIARVHFVYRPVQAGHFKGQIGFLIGTKGLKHNVEFAAHISDMVSATPSLIVLPRSSSQGDDYSCRVVFRGQPDTLMQLIEINFPKGFTYLQEKSATAANEVVILVSYRHDSGMDQKYPIREKAEVKIKVGNHVHEIDLPVRILR